MAEEPKEEKKGDKAPAQTRRSFLAISAATIAAELYATRKQHTQQFLHEQQIAQNALPITRFRALQGSWSGLLNALNRAGYTGFILADNHHHSAAGEQLMEQAVSFPDIGITDYFAEAPAPGKMNPELHEAFMAVHGQKIQAMSEAQQGLEAVINKVAAKQKREIAIHPADNHTGPDAQYTVEWFRLLARQQGHPGQRLLAGMTTDLRLPQIEKGFERDTIYRNHHMARTIAGIARKRRMAGQKFCFLFEVGASHLQGQEGVQHLLPRYGVTGTAIIDVLPVQDKQLNGVVLMAEGEPGHFAVMAHDPEQGLAFSRQGAVELNDGRTVLCRHTQPLPLTQAVGPFSVKRR